MKLIDPSDPLYFRQTSDKPYDRHNYRLEFNEGNKSLEFEDYEQLREQWMQIPNAKFTSNEFGGIEERCIFYDTSCSSVEHLFKNITIVITRDKYVIPSANYLRDFVGNCYV